jgi:hypothetical protein
MVVCWPGILPGVCFICKLYSTVTVFLAAIALSTDDKGENEDLHSLIQIESCVITCSHRQGSQITAPPKERRMWWLHNAEFIFSVIESVCYAELGVRLGGGAEEMKDVVCWEVMWCCLVDN